MNIVYELHAFNKTNDGNKPFTIKIFAPVDNLENFYCSVHAPELFGDDKKIYGVDADQAKDLAIKLLIVFYQAKLFSMKRDKR